MVLLLGLLASGKTMVCQWMVKLCYVSETCINVCESCLLYLNFCCRANQERPRRWKVCWTKFIPFTWPRATHASTFDGPCYVCHCPSLTILCSVMVANEYNAWFHRKINCFISEVFKIYFKCFCSKADDTGTLPTLVGEDECIRVEKYILPFELACQSMHSRFTNTSLDVLQVHFPTSFSYAMLCLERVKMHLPSPLVFIKREENYLRFAIYTMFVSLCVAF